ncbi:uncharacterized protein I303_108371 [Kwoniella dejecticola CBS 10117]|uniref:Uncharacterized protein n=1 Tax=Kwoniella dejecticola CBS 10117 TaxID=1296121 RepID=A0A1A5ZXK5_9TREE|nr:uncharacterized protein I303_07302 [Kwoniella dejecticola CBS 10117]OBR82542.1 hypothetical protein I303_07302 [Kwoniella dejecticola CBS 10117]
MALQMVDTPHPLRTGTRATSIELKTSTVPKSYQAVPSTVLTENQTNTVFVLMSLVSRSEWQDKSRLTLYKQLGSLLEGEIPRKHVPADDTWVTWGMRRLPIVDTTAYTTRMVTKIRLLDDGEEVTLSGGRAGEHGQNVEAINAEIQRLDEQAGHPVW